MQSIKKVSCGYLETFQFYSLCLSYAYLHANSVHEELTFNRLIPIFKRESIQFLQAICIGLILAQLGKNQHDKRPTQQLKSYFCVPYIHLVHLSKLYFRPDCLLQLLSHYSTFRAAKRDVEPKASQLRYLQNIKPHFISSYTNKAIELIFSIKLIFNWEVSWHFSLKCERSFWNTLLLSAPQISNSLKHYLNSVTFAYLEDIYYKSTVPSQNKKFLPSVSFVSHAKFLLFNWI